LNNNNNQKSFADYVAFTVTRGYLVVKALVAGFVAIILQALLQDVALTLDLFMLHNSIVASLEFLILGFTLFGIISIFTDVFWLSIIESKTSQIEELKK
jgi:hypothetical protein